MCITSLTSLLLLEKKKMMKRLLQQQQEHEDNKLFELSLGPSAHSTQQSKKRKFCWDHPVKECLPLDWEQCLDLESGKMYYLNRKTSTKSWQWPKEQKLDLELNISTPSSAPEEKPGFEMAPSSTDMVAVACMKCHLLVMLCRSSPCCPNCKYVHSLVPSQQQSLLSESTFKNTLSLLK